MVRYGKQIKTLDSFRLLPIEMWHEGKIFKNEEVIHALVIQMLQEKMCLT
jgi:hypothetical protein